jgi:NTE family protein
VAIWDWRVRGRRAWVLGGGGARGAAQVGALEALLEAGVEVPDQIFGVSVGALNGSTIAAYPTVDGARLLRETWISRAARDVFRPRPIEALVGRLRGEHRLSVLTSTMLRRLIQRQLAMIGVERIEELEVPFRVGVTDLAAGVPELLTEGPLQSALLASAAIPGVFPSVVIDGRSYVDGGVADNDPLARAVDSGARQVVAVALMAQPAVDKGPRGWGELILRTVAVGLHRKLVSEFERVRDAARVTVLCPLLPDSAGWQMDGDHLDAVMRRTRDAVRGLLTRRGPALFRHSGLHYLELAD